LSQVSATLATLQSQPSEQTTFSTKYSHSAAGFPCSKALHSEISSNAKNVRLALSLPLPDELVVINLSHQWLLPTTMINKQRSVNGSLNFLTILG
jgi:hypothetical protein